jgi:hypothetical protein
MSGTGESAVKAELRIGCAQLRIGSEEQDERARVSALEDPLERYAPAERNELIAAGVGYREAANAESEAQ